MIKVSRCCGASGGDLRVCTGWVLRSEGRSADHCANPPPRLHTAAMTSSPHAATGALQQQPTAPNRPPGTAERAPRKDPAPAPEPCHPGCTPTACQSTDHLHINHDPDDRVGAGACKDNDVTLRSEESP